MHNFHVTVVPSHLFDRYKNFERKFCEPRGKKKGEGKKASKKHFIPFHYRERVNRHDKDLPCVESEVLSTTTHECCMTASQFYSIEIISISKILLVLRASPSVWRDRWKRNALLSQKETKEGFSWITNKRLLLTHRRRRNNRERALPSWNKWKYIYIRWRKKLHDNRRLVADLLPFRFVGGQSPR